MVLSELPEISNDFGVHLTSSATEGLPSIRRMTPENKTFVCDTVLSNVFAHRVESSMLPPSNRLVPPPLPFDFEGTWQRNLDLNHRYLMMEMIDKLISDRARERNKFWSASCTRYIEIFLYRCGKSLIAYLDHATLEIRLNALARCIVKAKMKWSRNRPYNQKISFVDSRGTTQPVIRSFPATCISLEEPSTLRNQFNQSEEDPFTDFGVYLNERNSLAVRL
mmetsp:Transcript_14471/g.17705  ORF Transcript_14471/g.17705 Transcript_14471/m.17705 type:complete len:222 (-) Transcript_14471:432-1097(-)